jgi:hypothetical protein
MARGELLVWLCGVHSLGFAAFHMLFWVGRLVEQFVFLHINTPLVHVPTVLFALGALLFAAPLLA